MTEFLIDNDSLDELCVLQFASHFALHLNELKVHIFPFHVSHGKDGIDCDLCHLSVAPVDAERNNEY